MDHHGSIKLADFGVSKRIVVRWRGGWVGRWVGGSGHNLGDPSEILPPPPAVIVSMELKTPILASSGVEKTAALRMNDLRFQDIAATSCH